MLKKVRNSFSLSHSCDKHHLSGPCHLHKFSLFLFSVTVSLCFSGRKCSVDTCFWEFRPPWGKMRLLAGTTAEMVLPSQALPGPALGPVPPSCSAPATPCLPSHRTHWETWLPPPSHKRNLILPV